ncbi:hypothetical protein Tco_0018457 [Tanacetum coccineum]
MHGPYVRRMILEPGNPDCEVPVAETFHEQTDEELTKKEVKQMEADDQAIQTILMGLPEDILLLLIVVEITHHRLLICSNHYQTNNYIPQPSVNKNYMQQLMINPKDISDPTTAMNMAPILMGKAFKLNYSTHTRQTIKRISSKPSQPGRLYCQVVHNVVQNLGVQNIGNQNGLIVVSGIANQNVNQNGNGNVVAARAKGNGNGNNGNQTQLLIAQKEETGIQLQAKEFDLMAVAGDLDEIKEVNANYILMENLQQASTSSTQTDKAPVYDSDGSVEVHRYDTCYNNDIFNMFTQDEQYTKILDPKTEPHMIQQNNSNVISVESRVEHNRGTIEHHPATVFVSQKAKSREELYFSNTSETANVSKLVSTSISIPNEEFSDDTSPSVARKFLNDVKSTIVTLQQSDESLAKHKALEYEIECLLRAVVSQDIMSIVQNPIVVETSDLQDWLEV